MTNIRLAAAALLVAQSAIAQTQARPVAVIGGDRSGTVELYNPQDFAVIGDRLIVLDQSEPFIKVFDFSGKALQATVKKGAGPGEIVAVRSIVADPATRRVHLIDVMNRRASTFILRDTLTFESSLSVPLHVEDACVIGNHIFMMGMFGSHLIHEMEPKNGQYDFVRSFAVPRANPELDANPMFQHQVAIGRLACDPARQQIVAVSGYTGAAQIVNLRTLQQSTVKLDGFRTLWFREGKAPDGSGRPALSQGILQDGADWVRRVEVTPAGIRFFADHIDAQHIGNEDFSSVTEGIILPNGTVRKGAVSRQREIGRSGNRVACFVGSPIPTIEIYQAARCQ